MGSPIWLSEAAQAKTGIKNIHETLDALKDYEFERPEGDYTLIKEPIGVIGASMGGAIAMELARRHSTKINRLLLLSPAGLTGRLMPVPRPLDQLGVWFLKQKFVNHP